MIHVGIALTLGKGLRGAQLPVEMFLLGLAGLALSEAIQPLLAPHGEVPLDRLGMPWPDERALRQQRYIPDRPRASLVVYVPHVSKSVSRGAQHLSA